MDNDTHRVLELFEQISAIPRCSKKEDRIAGWLARWAQGRGYAVASDDVGNLVVRVPATNDAANGPTIVIQGHMDMVCEKTPDSPHDFSRDPISLIVEGDWITADRTTLGADNGIALAYAMAVAENPAVAHPPLELLFTVDEESGLLGARQMTENFVDGRILINIDSEDEGVFTVGCAGGEETLIELHPPFSAMGATDAVYRLAVAGLSGGHSGIDIHKFRASANKLLARALRRIGERLPYRIVDLKGGSTHNAIARDAEALIGVDPQYGDELKQIVAGADRVFKMEYADIETSLSVTVHALDEADTPPTALNPQESHQVAALLMALPHGVSSMSPHIEGLVETSSNLATVAVNARGVQVLSSQRSSVMSKLAEITATVQAVASLSGASARRTNHYPAWTPNMQSPLLERCQSVYQQLFKKKPVVQTIHAGLECGIIGAKHPQMDMISFGPDIRNPHSPDERMHIPSISRVWAFLTALLASYTQAG